MRRKSILVYTAGLITFTLILFLIFQLFLDLKPLLSWLVAVNATTFLAFGFDKRISRTSITRIPENTLILLALAGGTPAAYLGMRIFRHKISKRSFTKKFWMVVILQSACIAVYYIITTMYK